MTRLACVCVGLFIMLGEMVADAQTLTLTVSMDSLEQKLLPELCRQYNLCVPSTVLGLPAVMDWLVRHFSHGGCDNMQECGITLADISVNLETPTVMVTPTADHLQQQIDDAQRRLDELKALQADFQK